MAKIRVCREDELSPGDARKLDIDPPVAVFCTEEGFFALDDLCTHGLASLADGFVEDGLVECPLHMGQFCLKTGKPMSAPLTVGVATYPVSVESGEIFVEIARIPS